MSNILHNYVTKRTTSQPYSCKWIPTSCSIITVGKKVLGGVSKGDIKIHQLEFDESNNDEVKLNLIYENEFINPFRCMSFFNNQIGNGRKFTTGDFNGQISVWDSDICDIPIWGIKEAHIGCIAAIDAYGDNMIVSGGKDGSVSIWDTRTSTSSSSSTHTFQQNIRSNCWSICSNNDLIITGFENGDLNIYNLKTNSIQSTLKLDGGICSIDSNDRLNLLNQFITTTNKSFISLMNCDNGEINQNKIEINNIPNQTVWSGVYSPFNNKNNNKDGNIFTIAQGDGTVSMYKDNGILLDKAVVSDSPIISLDYSKDRKGLMCCVSLKKQLSVLISPY